MKHIMLMMTLFCIIPLMQGTPLTKTLHFTNGSKHSGFIEQLKNKQVLHKTDFQPWKSTILKNVAQDADLQITLRTDVKFQGKKSATTSIPAKLLPDNAQVHLYYRETKHFENLINQAKNLDPTISIDGMALERAKSMGAINPIHIYNNSSLSCNAQFSQGDAPTTLPSHKQAMVTFAKKPLHIIATLPDNSTQIHAQLPYSLFNGDGTDFLNINISKEDISSIQQNSNLLSYITLNNTPILHLLDPTKNTIPVIFKNESPHTGDITLHDGTIIHFKPKQELHLAIPKNTGFTVTMYSSVQGQWSMDGQDVAHPQAKIPSSKLSPNTTVKLTYDKNKKDQTKLQKTKELANFITIAGKTLTPEKKPQPAEQKPSTSTPNPTPSPMFNYAASEKKEPVPGTKTFYNQTNTPVLITIFPNSESGASILQPNNAPQQDGSYSYTLDPQKSATLAYGALQPEEITYSVQQPITYQRRVFSNQTNATVNITITTNKTPVEFSIKPYSSTSTPITQDTITQIKISGNKQQTPAYLENTSTLTLNHITGCTIAKSAQSPNTFSVSIDQGAVDAFSAYSKDNAQLTCHNNACNLATISQTLKQQDVKNPEITSHEFCTITQASMENIQVSWDQQTPQKLWNPVNFKENSQQYKKLLKQLSNEQISLPKLETVHLTMQTYQPAEQIQEQALTAQKNKSYDQAANLFKQAAEKYMNQVAALQKQSPLPLKTIGDYTSFAAQLYFSSALQYKGMQASLTNTASAFNCQSKALSALCAAYASYLSLLYNEELLITKQSSANQKELLQQLTQKVEFSLAQTIVHAQNTLQALVSLTQQLPLPKASSNKQYQIKTSNNQTTITIPYHEQSVVEWTNTQIDNPWFGLSQFTKTKAQTAGAYFAANYPNLVFAKPHAMQGNLQIAIGNALQVDEGQKLSASLPPLFWGPKQQGKTLLENEIYTVGLPQHTWSGFDLNVQLCTLQTRAAMLLQTKNLYLSLSNLPKSSQDFKAVHAYIKLLESITSQANLTMNYLLNVIPNLEKQSSFVADFDNQGFARIFSQQYFALLIPILEQEMNLLQKNTPNKKTPIKDLNSQIIQKHNPEKSTTL